MVFKYAKVITTLSKITQFWLVESCTFNPKLCKVWVGPLYVDANRNWCTYNYHLFPSPWQESFIVREPGTYPKMPEAFQRHFKDFWLFKVLNISPKMNFTQTNTITSTFALKAWVEIGDFIGGRVLPSSSHELYFSFINWFKVTYVWERCHSSGANCEKLLHRHE